MDNQLFVANLPWAVNDQQLMDFFGQVGLVKSSRIITDRETGRSRGFGFVEYEDSETALEAINQLNGADFNGRAIVVKRSEPKNDKINQRR